MWTPSQVNLKFELNFWNYQPSCLPSSSRWARVTRYEAVRPVRPWSLVWPYVLPVPDCLRVAAPSLSLLGWSPASSLPPHSTPCRYNNPAPWCSQSHPRTPCWPGVRGNIPPPATSYIPPLLNLLLLPPSQHRSPSPPLIKVYQRESTEADNWNFVKYPLAPWCRCTAAIETVLWSG